MRGLRVGGLGFAMSVVLTACGGAPSALVPRAPALTDAGQPHRSGTWMDAHLRKQTLLYVSNANGEVNVYSYWLHELVGVLTDFQQPAGACVDKAGDVYIVDYKAKTISEYEHGAKKRLRVIKDAYQPLACSVDRTTGNLAVANYGETYADRGFSSQYAGNLAIYARAQGKPTYYGGRFDHFSACAYDDRGDLLASAQNGYSGYYSGYFVYLPKKSKSTENVNLPPPKNSSSWEWGYVNGVAYDGKYWVVDAYRLYRYSINIQAQYVDTIDLTDGIGAGGVALFRKTPDAQATQLAASIGYNGQTTDVGYWKYPAGGSPYYEITADLDSPDGVAISNREP